MSGDSVHDKISAAFEFATTFVNFNWSKFDSYLNHKVGWDTLLIGTIATHLCGSLTAYPLFDQLYDSLAFGSDEDIQLRQNEFANMFTKAIIICEKKFPNSCK